MELLKQGMSNQNVKLAQIKLKELGFFTGTPRGNFGPQTEAAVRSFQAEMGLAADGVIGPDTWGKLFGEDAQDQGIGIYDYLKDIVSGGTAQPPQPQRALPKPKPGEVPPWLLEAFRDLAKGKKEIPGSQDNPDIVAAHAHTTLHAQDDETPWCSSQMCEWMDKAGFPSTKSAAAISWASWGRELEKPCLGCVVVMSRLGGNHVCLYLDGDDGGAYCIGGNQGDRVSIKRFSWDNITNYRWVA